MHVYKEQKFPFFRVLIIAALFFFIGFKTNDLGLLDGNSASVDQDSTPVINEITVNDEKVDLKLFWDIWEILEEEHVDGDKADYQSLVYGAIAGMVNGLDDPYTVFMNPDESEEFSKSLDGTLEGIGAELTVEEGNLTVVSPLKNSPAENAGLLPGDIIAQVDGESTYEMTLFDAIMNIRGEQGTEVILTIVREDLGDPFDVTIVRDSIDLEEVSYEKIDEIAYLSVNQFNERTVEEFKKYIDQSLTEGAKAYIIDLRFNGGGYLDASVELLEHFLPKYSDAVIIKQRILDDQVLKTKATPEVQNMPLVVLVNEGSASASEIFAGAIMAHDRGVVMGTQTFGKGTVQELKTFKDGSTLRITIAKWFTPDDININETGITPDIIVDFIEEDYENEYDRQKEEAVKYLEGLITKG